MSEKTNLRVIELKREQASEKEIECERERASEREGERERASECERATYANTHIQTCIAHTHTYMRLRMCVSSCVCLPFVSVCACVSK